MPYAATTSLGAVAKLLEQPAQTRGIERGAGVESQHVRRPGHLESRVAGDG